MTDLRALRADPGLPLRRERVAVDADAFATIRANVRRGVETWVSAVVADDAGRVALVRNSWSDGWVAPGGSVEPGEGLRAAAAREVREETGLRVAVEAPVAVVEEVFERDGRAVWGHRVVFAARAASTELAEDPGLDGEGIEAVDWFGALPDRLQYPALVARGRAALAAVE